MYAKNASIDSILFYDYDGPIKSNNLSADRSTAISSSTQNTTMARAMNGNHGDVGRPPQAKAYDPSEQPTNTIDNSKFDDQECLHSSNC